MERQHADFWMALADGYRLLQVTYSELLQSNYSSSTASNSDNGDTTSPNAKQLNVSDQLGDILSNTVSLFRPYFSWRDITSGPDASKMKQLLITKDNMLTSDKKDKSSLPIAHTNTAKMKSDHLDLEQSVNAWCLKDCPFFTHSQWSTESNSSCCIYRDVVGRLANPDLTLCLLHSPFVILASRQAAVDEFMELLKSIAQSRSIELLCSFYAMAECSCYLWARYCKLYLSCYM